MYLLCPSSSLCLGVVGKRFGLSRKQALRGLPLKCVPVM